MQPTILIVSDEPSTRQRLARVLEDEFYTVAAVPFAGCDTGAAALADVMLIDYGAPETGAALTRAAIGPERIAFNLGGAAEAAYRAGVEEFSEWPDADADDLRMRLRALLRDRATAEEARRRSDTARDMGLSFQTGPFAPGAALVVGAAPAGLSRLIEEEARAQGLRIQSADTFDAGLTMARFEPPALALIWGGDAAAPALNRAANALSRAGARRRCGVLAATPAGHVGGLDPTLIDATPAASAPAALAIRFRALAKRWRMREAMNDMFAAGIRLAAVDALTGLYNRRYADAHVDRHFAAAKAGGGTVSVLMADVDRFKMVNDRYGHQTGDEVLAALARRLEQNVRRGDMVARIGGEEFLVAMPDIGHREALKAADRLRRAVCETPLALPDGGRAHLTISIGVATAARTDRDAETLRRRADRALMAAKASGRNRVTARGGRVSPPGLAASGAANGPVAG